MRSRGPGGGDFSLADAMELAHRMKESPEVLGGFLLGGRLRYLEKGWRENPICHHCDGDGTVLCPDCEDDPDRCDKCSAATDHMVRHEDCKGRGCSKCDQGLIACPECDGTGNEFCERCRADGYVDCSECSGEGYFELDLAATEDYRIEDLNGDVVFRGEGHDAPDLGQPVNRAWATQILEAYAKSQAEAANAATPSAQIDMLETAPCA